MVDKQISEHRLDFMTKGLKSIYQGMKVKIPDEKCVSFSLMLNNLINACLTDEVDPLWDAQYTKVMDVIDFYHKTSNFTFPQIKKFHEHLDDLLEEVSSEAKLFAETDLIKNISMPS